VLRRAIGFLLNFLLVKSWRILLRIRSSFRRKKEEGRGKREEGRGKREEGRDQENFYFQLSVPNSQFPNLEARNRVFSIILRCSRLDKKPGFFGFDE
jgi:hypothetical protein